jgi:hypothetical protein
MDTCSRLHSKGQMIVRYKTIDNIFLFLVQLGRGKSLKVRKLVVVVVVVVVV